MGEWVADEKVVVGQRTADSNLLILLKRKNKE